MMFECSVVSEADDDVLVTSACELSLKETEPEEILAIDGPSADLEVSSKGKVMKVHKSVVRCCPYFAAIIDGHWLESQTSNITIDGYSYESVYFVMEHLYQSKLAIDNDQDLGELVALSDMLGLQSLLILVTSTLVSKLCHNFHKPCQECVIGVVNTLQLTYTYNLTEVYARCLAWFTKYFVKTWNSRAFASLPGPHQRKCLDSVQNSVNKENAFDVLLDCQKIQELFPSVKWVEPIDILVKELVASTMLFVQEHFQDILKSSKFQSLKRDDDWRLGRVEVVLLEAIANLPVEQACLSYVTLEDYLLVLPTLSEDERPDINFIELITKIHQAVENRLVQRVGMATKCSSWHLLNESKQTFVMQKGFFNPMDKKTQIAARSLNRNSSTNSSPNARKTESIRQPSVQERKNISRTTVKQPISSSLKAQRLSNSPQNQHGRVPVELNRTQSAHIPNTNVAPMSSQKNPNGRTAATSRSTATRPPPGSCSGPAV